MKIATYNINGVRARLANLLAWLEREQPAVACLQELKAPDEAFPQQALREAGYEAVWHGQKSWNGVAILARGVAPEETQRGLPGDPDDSHSRYLEAIVHGVRIGCLYLPNGNPQPGPKFDYKLKWMARFNAHAAKLWKSGEPVVLCGDYNVVPTDFDIYNPASWRHDALLQPESRAAFEKLLAQGWTDALRARFPNDKIYTFWDYFRQHWQRNSGLRIDHLLLSKSLAPKLLDAGVNAWVRGETGASDHAPTWVELDVHAAKKPPAKKVASKPAVKKPAVKKPAVKKPAAKKAAPRTASAKSPAATKPARKKALATALLLLAASLSIPFAPAAQARPAAGRIMMPAAVRCDARLLNTYFGKVVAYRRNASGSWLRIATDFDTLDEVSVPKAAEKHYLYRGRPFTAKDWARIERKPGVLRPGTRATAWVCSDGKTPPLIDWNGAAE